MPNMTKLQRRRLRESRQTKGGKNGHALPAKWTPRFLDEADQRLSTIREIRKRVKWLVRDSGADSYQKELLAGRAAFIACRLETMETIAVTEGKIDFGVYVQAVNALSGLLAKLGLDKKVITTPWKDEDEDDEED